MKIVGKWKGYYQYGYGYDLPFFGEKVNVEVVFSGSNNSFTGKAIEEKSNFSVPLESTIKGFIEDNFISYVLTYPKFPYFKKSDSVEMSFKDKPHRVEYEGYFDEKNNAMYGRWSIIHFDSEYGEILNEGTWMLKK